MILASAVGLLSHLWRAKPNGRSEKRKSERKDEGHSRAPSRLELSNGSRERPPLPASQLPSSFDYADAASTTIIIIVIISIGSSVCPLEKDLARVVVTWRQLSDSREFYRASDIFGAKVLTSSLHADRPTICLSVCL